jgi:hypothetical protein
MSNGMNVQAVLAGLFASGLPPEEIKKQYLDTLQTAGEFTSFEDPLYPHVKLFRRTDGTIHGYVIKTRGNAAEATREVEALRHWAKQNDIDLSLPHYLPLVSTGQFVLSPYVGPEVYTVEHQLSERLAEIGEEREETRNSLATFRRAIVLRQVDMLARAVVAPYVPEDEHGHVLVANRDVVGNYKQNMREFFVRHATANGGKDDPLKKALEYVTSFFVPSFQERYVDTYARNMCFRIRPKDTIRVTLDDILRVREESHAERTITELFTMDMIFLQPRLVQVDLHRNEKLQLKGECLENIIDAPGLRRFRDKPFGYNDRERMNAIARFELRLEEEREAAKGSERRRDYLNDIAREIEKTSRGDYPVANLASILRVDPRDAQHYHAIAFYKAVRWIEYVTTYYIPEYEAAAGGRDKSEAAREKRVFAKERLELYRIDREIYKQTAREALYALMSHLFDQLTQISDEGSNKLGMITLNHTKSPGTPYGVIRRNNAFQLLSSKRQKIIATDEGFRYHMGELDRRAETPEEKAYAGLVKLGYLDHLLAKA